MSTYIILMMIKNYTYDYYRFWKAFVFFCLVFFFKSLKKTWNINNGTRALNRYDWTDEQMGQISNADLVAVQSGEMKQIREKRNHNKKNKLKFQLFGAKTFFCHHFIVIFWNWKDQLWFWFFGFMKKIWVSHFGFEKSSEQRQNIVFI